MLHSEDQSENKEGFITLLFANDSVLEKKDFIKSV